MKTAAKIIAVMRRQLHSLRSWVAVITLITQLGMFVPLTARAAVPVLENNPALLASETTTSISTLESIVQTILEWAWRFTQATLKKQILNVLVDQTIAWIQGTGGKPQLVTDWRGFLENAGKEAIGELARESGAGFLCSPFSLSVRIGLFPIQRFSKIDQRAKCTLDTIVSNIENFYGDFREGGWLAYQVMLEPQNNIFGASLMLQLEERDRTAAKTEARLNEAMSAGGFLSTKDCKKDSAGRDIPSTCRITTPGRLLGDQTAKALGASIDFIVNAEEIGDYAAAIADALLNRLIAEGTKGLVGVSAPDIPETVYVDAGQLAGPCAGLPNDALQACLNSQNQFGQNFQFNANTIAGKIEATLTPLIVASNSYNKSILTLQTHITQLQSIHNQFTALTQCSPKPNGQSNNITPAQLTQIKSDLAALIIAEQSAKNSIDAQNKQTIDSKIKPLDAALVKIKALPPDQYGEISAIYNSVISLINIDGAVYQREQAMAQYDETVTRSGANTSSYNDKLNQCLNPTNF